MKLTDSQNKRVKQEIAELSAKLQSAKEKLAQTLDIAKVETGWDEWIEEDTNKVKYLENHIERLNKILENGRIEVA